MLAFFSRRTWLLPLWAGVGACSLVVDTAPINAQGCGSLQRLCDNVCRDMTDPGYGCGRCQVCELESVQGAPTGYASIQCIATTSTSGINMHPEASMGSSSTYKCDLEHPTCIDGFSGERCQYPDHDFTGFLCDAGSCKDGKRCVNVRPGVEVCI